MTKFLLRPPKGGTSLEPVRLKECDPHFIDEVIEAGGRKARLCFECGTCSAGCPVAYAMDYTPRQLLRMVELGMRQEVLRSKTIWTCAACHTCTARCPRGVELSHVMGALKSIAIKEGIIAKNPKGPAFYKSFEEIIEENGRIFEPLLMVKFALRTEFWSSPAKFTWGEVFDPGLAMDAAVGAIQRLLKDMPMAMELSKKGKIDPMPHKIMGIAGWQKLIENVHRIEAEER